MVERQNTRINERPDFTSCASSRPETPVMALDAILEETMSVLMDAGTLLDALLLHTEGGPRPEVPVGESAGPSSLMEHAAINRELANGVREKVRHLAGLLRTS